jgi:hypothetical protein
MPIHLPARISWGILNGARKAVSWLYGRAAQLIALPVYRRSHGRWVRRNRLGTDWRQLGSYLEYSLHIGQLTDPLPRQSRIAVRALPGVTVERASFVFEATGHAQRYQEPVTLYNLDETPVTWTMSQVPHDEPIVFPSGGISFRIDNSRFINIEVTVPGRGVIRERDTQRSYYTHTWFLNSEWKRFDDVVFNLDAIKCCKQNIAIYWRFGFFSPMVYSSRAPRFSSYQLMFFATRPLANLMATKWAVSAQFWIAALTFYRFTEEGELAPRFAKRADIAVGKAEPD